VPTCTSYEDPLQVWEIVPVSTLIAGNLNGAIEAYERKGPFPRGRKPVIANDFLEDANNREVFRQAAELSCTLFSKIRFFL
jgi:hypothetical protein